MRNKNGFTLVELLVTIAMLSVIGTIIIYSTIGLTNNTKELQYERMVENIENATKTYISLHPEEFSDLYSTKAYTYIQLQTVINSGLLDDGLENPYTKEKINGSEEIKVYIDGESGELVYKYPVTDADRNNEIWLQTVTMTVQIDLTGKALINLFTDVGTSNLGLVNETGIIINDYNAQGYSNNRDYYKKYYNMEVSAPGLQTCEQAGTLTEIRCGISAKYDVGSIWYDGAQKDFFVASKAGNYYIEYSWKLPGTSEVRKKKRLVRVIDNTSQAEKDKQKGETPVVVVTPTDDDDDDTNNGEDQLLYNLADHISEYEKENFKTNGRYIHNDDYINTGVRLMEKDRNFAIIMVSSIASDGQQANTASQQFFHSMKEIKPYSGITLRDNYNSDSKNGTQKIKMGLCSDVSCAFLYYKLNVPWKIIVYRDVKYPNVAMYSYCSDYDVQAEKCNTTVETSYIRYVYEYYNKETILGAYIDQNNSIDREMDGFVYDFRLYFGINTAKTEISKLERSVS